MNKNIFQMSMFQNRRNFIVWAFTLPALVVMGMAFYPAISESMSELVGLFENPMMKTMLGLFAMGPEQLSSLPGFYVTYASIYVILMGGIFAALSSFSEIANELRDKTAEFLLTRPVSRRSIILTKWIAIEVRIALVLIILCLVTLGSFSVFSKNAPMSYYENENAVLEITKTLKSSPDNIQKVWTFDGDLFQSWMLVSVSQSLTDNPEEVEALPISESDMAELLDKMTRDPEGLLDDMVNNPITYMEMFDMPPSALEEYEKAVAERRTEYNEVKENFTSNANFQYEVFDDNPELFLSELKTLEDRNRFIQLYPSEKSQILSVIKPYSTIRVMLFHVYLFFFMSAISALSMLLSVSIKQAKNVTGIGIGMVMVLYFISTLAKISPQTAFIAWFSPFGLVDQNLTGVTYTLDYMKLGLLTLETTVFMLITVIVFERKDIAS